MQTWSTGCCSLSGFKLLMREKQWRKFLKGLFFHGLNGFFCKVKKCKHTQTCYCIYMWHCTECKIVWNTNVLGLYHNWGKCINSGSNWKEKHSRKVSDSWQSPSTPSTGDPQLSLRDPQCPGIVGSQSRWGRSSDAWHLTSHIELLSYLNDLKIAIKY